MRSPATPKTTMHLKHIQSCRVCGSTALTPVINLGLQHLQGSFVKLGMNMPPNRRIPCELVRCDPTRDENACGLLQMKHSVPPEILYSNYWYVSGTNQTMRDHLKDIAGSANSFFPDSHVNPRRVLDIGCNDLTLLNFFPEDWDRIGIDPSNVSDTVPESGIRVVKDFFPSDKIDGQFDVITSIAMFYDLEDPVNFARSIRELLSDDGIWIVEMAYMPTMLANNSYDTICHEHLLFYSLSVLDRVMRKAGLSIFRALLNGSNGGSIQCYVQHEGASRSNHGWQEELKFMRQFEFDLELDTDKPYASFQSRICNHRDKLVAILRKLKQDGKTIHIYGASTKGNTLLQWCGIDSRLIDCAADRNPAKNQAMTLGTCIQIVSEEESRARNPDYYLVLPWHFRSEFIQREREAHALTGRSPGFIFPLPEIEVIPPMP